MYLINKAAIGHLPLRLYRALTGLSTSAVKTSVSFQNGYIKREKRMKSKRSYFFTSLFLITCTIPYHLYPKLCFRFLHHCLTLCFLLLLPCLFLWSSLPRTLPLRPIPQFCFVPFKQTKQNLPQLFNAFKSRPMLYN